MKSSKLMTVFKTAQKHWHALVRQRGGSLPDEGEQLSGILVRVGSVKISKRKLNFSLSVQENKYFVPSTMDLERICS